MRDLAQHYEGENQHRGRKHLDEEAPDNRRVDVKLHSDIQGHREHGQNDGGCCDGGRELSDYAAYGAWEAYRFAEVEGEGDLVVMIVLAGDRSVKWKLGYLRLG